MIGMAMLGAGLPGYAGNPNCIHCYDSWSDLVETDRCSVFLMIARRIGGLSGLLDVWLHLAVFEKGRPFA